jgi:predicted Zn-dependent peptidase
LRDFPGEIRSLSLDDVNEAVRRYLDFDQLRVVIAGSLPEVQ